MTRRAPAMIGLFIAAWLGATPAAAFASGRHTTRNPRPGHATTPRPKPAPKTQRFTADGLLVAASPTTLRVLTNQLHVGTRTLPNRVVTVTRPTTKPGTTRSATAAATPVGDRVTISGQAVTAGSRLTLVAAQEAIQPQPAEVFLGTLTNVTDTTAEVAETMAVDGGESGDEQHTLTVDTSAATVTVDGAAGQLAADQFVVVLGERDHDTVVAASVYAYSATPAVVGGEIHAVDGSTVTVGDQDNAATVDLAPGGTPVPVLLNGTTTADPTSLNPGYKIVVIGRGTPDAFTATTAFVFDSGDDNPTGDNGDNNPDAGDGNHRSSGDNGGDGED